MSEDGKELSDLTDTMFLVDLPDAGTSTLSFEKSPTVLLCFAANRFTRMSARVYQAQFGIGAMDWRMLVMLTREPGSSVSHAGRTIGIDKGAVSRSLRRLQGKNLAQPEPDKGTAWYLTDAGKALHTEILALALARQKSLLDGFSADDVAAFNHYLSTFMANLERLDAE